MFRFVLATANGEVLGHGLAGNVVGWRASQRRPVVFARSIDHDIAVAHSWMKCHPGEFDMFGKIHQ